MAKFVTRDNKSVKVKINENNDKLMDLLQNTIPRLSFEEILEGELEKRLKDAGMSVDSLELSDSDDIKQILLSKAIFDAISKPMGG